MVQELLFLFNVLPSLIVSIDTRRSLSMKLFIWPINSGVLTSLLLPHLFAADLTGVVYLLEYRTLYSYKLFWAVCHLFPQRWRTLNIQSRETIGQEDHVTCLKLGPRVNLSPAFLSHLQTRIFYKYVVFKHPCSLGPKFFAAATHSLQRESTGEKSNTMNGPRRHSYTMTMRRFPVSEKLPVSNHKKKDILNLQFFL